MRRPGDPDSLPGVALKMIDNPPRCHHWYTGDAVSWTPPSLSAGCGRLSGRRDHPAVPVLVGLLPDAAVSNAAMPVVTETACRDARVPGCPHLVRK
jgi:hypothetical protein